MPFRNRFGDKGHRKGARRCADLFAASARLSGPGIRRDFSNNAAQRFLDILEIAIGTHQ